MAHSAPRRWWTTVAIEPAATLPNDQFDQCLPQSFIGEQLVRQDGDRLGAVITRALQHRR